MSKFISLYLNISRVYRSGGHPKDEDGFVKSFGYVFVF